MENPSGPALIENQTMRVETPENVEIEYPIAGPGSRFMALLVDFVLIAVVLLGVPLIVALGIRFFGLEDVLDPFLLMAAWTLFSPAASFSAACSGL